MRFVRALSAATTTPLETGEIVNLSLVVGNAWKESWGGNGTVCRFEIFEITPKIREQLLKLCERLPLFQSMIDV
jgi:hypothetical protein